MITKELHQVLRAAGLPSHAARREERRIRRLARTQAPAAAPIAQPTPSGPIRVVDGEDREIGMVEPIKGRWRASTRAGIRVGTFETAAEAIEQLTERVARFRAMARGDAR